MPRLHSIPFRILILAVALPLAFAWAAPAPARAAAHPLAPAVEESLALEARAAIRRGTAWLLAARRADGSWSGHRALTSLAVLALLNAPDGTAPDGTAPAAARAVAWLTAQERHPSTGSEAQYPTLHRALGALAVARLQREQDWPYLHAIRQQLLAAQDPDSGGFRPAPDAPPDLVSTAYALETLHVTTLASLGGAAPEDATAAARRFLAHCRQPDGSFRDALPAAAGNNGRRATERRSPGFRTAAGLKGLLYAGARPGASAEVDAALGWLARGFTVRENPGAGQAGYYTWICTATQALQMAERCGWRPDAAAGRLRNWRPRVIIALLERQQGDGPWRQPIPDWWETRPELATAYALLALELALRE
ncbi:MAG: prenyltransferase/squalene oxidase repeat-containing protein [Lentisphaeria bacterium]|jgi:hypothetical protein